MEKQDIVKQTKQLVSSPVPGTYFLYGGEEFLKRRFLSDIKKAVIPDDAADLNYSVVSGPDQADRVLELGYTLPQFSDARMIVWYNSGYPLTQARFKKKTDEVVERIGKFPYLYLMIYATEDEFDQNGRDGRAALSKLDCNQLCFEKLTPSRVLGWVERHFDAGKTVISEDDCKYLIDRAGTGIDPSALMAYVCDCRSRAEKPQVILGSIISEAEKLCRIKLAHKKGLPYQTAAKQLGLNEYVVKLAYQSVSDVTEKRIYRFLHACHEADKKLKTSSSNAWGTLIQLVCSV